MLEALRIGLGERASRARIAEALRAQGCAGDDQRLLAIAGELSDFIARTPDRIRTLMRLTRQPLYGRAVAFGLAQVLVYVVDEKDLVSDDRDGGEGLLDDAYLVFRFLGDVCNTYPLAREHVAPDDSSETGAMVSRLLPDGVASALDQTCARLLVVGSALFQGGESHEHDSTSPRLRIDSLGR